MLYNFLIKALKKFEKQTVSSSRCFNFIYDPLLYHIKGYVLNGLLKRESKSRR